MRQFFLTGVLLLSAALGDARQAAADPVTIVSYDVLNAVVSGAGGWAHVYTGTITPTTSTGTFTSVANYTGGGGTLNDGIIGRTVMDTQLFEVPADSVITLHLSQAVPLQSISLFGGDMRDNSIPGSLRGTITVTANGMSAAVPALPFGRVRSSLGQHVNDQLLLRGTLLDGLVTDRITLSGFTSESLTRPVGYYSLTEITINQAAPVPEPATMLLFGAGAAAVSASRWRRHRSS
jgi:hypothetical protein